MTRVRRARFAVLTLLVFVASVFASTGAAARSVSDNLGTESAAREPMPLALAGYSAALISASAHPEVIAGATAQMTIKYKNVGTAEWPAGLAHLGTWGPEPGPDQPSAVAHTSWPSPNRPARIAGAVAPGADADFAFTIQAPTTPGTYWLYVRPVVENLTWLDDYGVYWRIIVLKSDGTRACVSEAGPTIAPPATAPASQSGYHAAVYGFTAHPKQMCPGDVLKLRIGYYNSGSIEWPAGTARLGTYGPHPGQDRPSVLGGTWLGWPHAVRPAQVDTAVQPGQSANFEFSVHAPRAPGVYWIFVRPLVEGTTWLEDYGVFWRIVVLNGDGTAACRTEPGTDVPPPASAPSGIAGFHAAVHGFRTSPGQVCPGDVVSLSITYRNVGTMTWTPGTAEARLGTWGAEPGHDRPSVLGGTWLGWPHAVRPARQAESPVPPDSDVKFEFNVQAPIRPGIYWIFVRPLIEGVTWMEDYGVHWRITVLNPDGTLPRIACGAECWPLLGTPVAGGPVGRRALSVRIDNAGAARPHYGISQADMVFETLIDSFRITRLNYILHSKDPGTIGSVRSARLVDRYLTPMVRGGLAFAGSTIEEHDLIRQDAAAGRYLDLSFNSQCGSTPCGSAYYRVGFRPSPYNLFTSSSELRRIMTAAGGGAAVEVPRWGFLAPDVEHPAHAGGMLGSAAARVITIPNSAPAVTVRYEYDGRTYARYQGGVREVDAANNVAVATRNIVVIYTDVWSTNIVEDVGGSRGLDMCLAKDAPLYPGSFAGKPASCTGTGAATIFRDGRRQDGTWKRDSINDAFTFTSAYGDPILLSPGQTFIHVIPRDWNVPSS